MQIEKKRNENVQFKYPDLLQETNDAHVDKIKMVRNIGGKKITWKPYSMMYFNLKC